MSTIQQCQYSLETLRYLYPETLVFFAEDNEGSFYTDNIAHSVEELEYCIKKGLENDDFLYKTFKKIIKQIEEANK
jgi:hypothetical protein